MLLLISLDQKVVLEVIGPLLDKLKPGTSIREYPKMLLGDELASLSPERACEWG